MPYVEELNVNPPDTDAARVRTWGRSAVTRVTNPQLMWFTPFPFFSARKYKESQVDFH